MLCVELSSVTSNLDKTKRIEAGTILSQNATEQAILVQRGVKCKYTDGDLDAC